MKIVADDKIPYIREKLLAIADEAVFLPGSAISAADVRDADALVVRTRTRCDRSLLEGSRVSLVLTATIGFDHLDTDYLDSRGIRWANCPGCNSGSVAQYVECSLLLLERLRGVSLAGCTIGIVGCGHVGSKVALKARLLGMRVLVCDPPLSPADGVGMDVIERESDIVSFHVPLTTGGPYPTYHLADGQFFSRLARKPYIINTSRGAVVDNAALLCAIEGGQVADAVIDVWEQEPHPDRALLERVFLSTPHIAGYSADGKANADNMVIDALCGHFHRPHPGVVVPPSLPAGFVWSGDPLELYNPLTDSKRLKEDPRLFESLRNNYPLRRERAD